MSRIRACVWTQMGVLVALAIVWSLSAEKPLSAQTVVDQPVTYNKDIAPIFQRSCQHCHRQGSVAPMSLLTYKEVRPYARSIKQRTALRYAPYSRGVMPPWFLEKNIGIQHMKDDISLTDVQIAMIARWVDSGAPEGNPADLPKALTFAEDGTWTLGKPDLIVSSPTFLVPAEASDSGTAIGSSAPIALDEDRYLKSVEFKEVSEFTSKTPPAGAGKIGQGVPGSLYAIHHANVAIVKPGDESDLGDPEDLGGADSGDRLPIHEVGRNGDVFPDDAAKLLPAHAIFVFDNVHVHSAGVPGSERKTRLDIGLRLQPKGYKPKYQLTPISFGQGEIAIMPGQNGQRLDAYYVTTAPIKMWNFEPHMHAAGVRMCIEAIYRHTTETLNCAGYDHNWVRNYIYDENYEPLIPKGTILHSISYFDNNAKNQNVLDPRNISVWGNSSVNNMITVFDFGVVLTDEQYQQELAKRRAFLATTHEEPIGCPDCYKQSPAPKSATMPDPKKVAER
ncbi:MAG: hypothetical protein ABSB35_32855 [Bryobacteraceae bacterium]